MKLDLSSTGESPSCLSAADAEAAPEVERPGSLSAPSPLAAAATELSLEEGGGSGLPICEQVWASSANGLFLASSCGRQRQEEGEGVRLQDQRNKWCKWGCPGSWVGTESTSGGGQREGLGEKSESARWAAQLGRTALTLPVAGWWDSSLYWNRECAAGPGEPGSGSGPPKATEGEGDFCGVGAVTCPLPSNLLLL